MEVNWIIIGLVVLGAIVLVVYLVRQNLKDEKEVTEFFNHQSDRKVYKSEPNDEK